MRVKVNTQRSRVTKCNTQRLPPIKQLLTDDIISENWRTPGLPIGNYYASLGNKYAYFYAVHCVNENPAGTKIALLCTTSMGSFQFIGAQTVHR